MVPQRAQRMSMSRTLSYSPCIRVLRIIDVRGWGSDWTARTAPLSITLSSLEERLMRVSRRTFVQTTAAAGAAIVGTRAASAQGRGNTNSGNAVPPSILALKPLPNPPPPITDDERRARIAKAQKLMTEHGMGAIVMETGTSMSYFVNVRWGLSERPFLLVLPAKGEPAYISPGFEEQRAREVIRF